MLFHQEHELSKRVQSARETEWEKITQLEQAKLQVSDLPNNMVQQYLKEKQYVLSNSVIV